MKLCNARLLKLCVPLTQKVGHLKVCQAFRDIGCILAVVEKVDRFKAIVGTACQSSAAVTQTTSKESDVTTGKHMGSCDEFPIPLLSFIYACTHFSI